MPLFTLLLDYAGGTYIDQVEARSPEGALRRWGAALQSRRDSAIPVRSKARLIGLARTDAPQPVQGRRNVWCSSGLVDSQLALIHIVLTRKR